MTVPIVAMTAHAMPSDRLKSLQAGMNDHLSKPIDPPTLFLTLLKWIPPRPRANAPDLCATCVANNAPSSSSWTSMPTIPGFNVHGGITRLAGNQEAYLRLLKRFYTTYHTFPDRLQTLFATQQFDEILNLVHSLKGVSGNLGAEDLYQALSDFNQMLKQSEEPSPNLHLYFDRVQQTLTALLQTLDDSSLLTMDGQTETNTTWTSSPPEKVPLQLLLKSFSELLDRDLGAAIAVFEQLKQLEHRSEFQSILVAMETELETFNLDSVHQHLRVLTAYLDPPHHNGHSASG